MYVAKDAILVPDFLRDLRSFFAKFPVQYEVIFILEKNSKKYLPLLLVEKEKSPPQETLIFQRNEKYLGRAHSLVEGLNNAKAPALLIVSPEMSSPLADTFNLWQNLVTEASADVCWGNRYNKKNSPFKTSESPRLRSERFFIELLGQHNTLPQDSLCEVLAFKKSSWEKINSSIINKTHQGWYLSSLLRNSSILRDLKIIEVPVYDSGASSPAYSVWLERWNLMKLMSRLLR